MRKYKIVILCCLLISSCINNIDTFPFSKERVQEWEKATFDTIQSIYKRNKQTADTFQLMLLNNHKNKIYNHQLRQCFISDLKNDTTFCNAKITNCIVIETQYESKMYNMIIYSSNNQNICLSYRLWYTTDITNKSFMLYEKDTIDNKKLQKFIQEVRKSDLFKNENNNGEYYNGNILVSFFLMDKVEIFPYLTFNFSNDLYRSYNELFEMKRR